MHEVFNPFLLLYFHIHLSDGLSHYNAEANGSVDVSKYINASLALSCIQINTMRNRETMQVTRW